jgi:predicted nucleic acid-binding protein
MPHVTVERWEAVRDAVDLHRRGLDFADALHWACSRGCERFVTFDDRRLARRARRLRLATPPIVLAR